MGLGVFRLVVPPLLVFLPWRVSSDLAHPDTAGPATTVLNLTGGVLIELARLGVVIFTDAQPRGAVWLGLGVHAVSALFGVAAFLGPSAPGREHAVPGRLSSYRRDFFGFGRNILVNVGLSLLLVLSPWLAFITIPAGAVWEGLIGRGSRP